MIRASTIFVGICMALIAASFGLVLYAVAGINGPQSALVALAALIFMILHGVVSMRLNARPKFGSQIADLSQGTADLARQVGEFGRRLGAIEGRMMSATTASQDRLNAMHDEISELGGLVNQLAEAVAAHDDQIADGLIAATMPEVPLPFQPAPPPVQARLPASAPARPAMVATATDDFADDYLDFDVPQPASDDAMIDVVRAAIDANRIDIYLQPIVTLPQRKVRFYEAVTRLRNNGERVIAAEDFIAPAEAAGLIDRIDHVVIQRSVEVLRRLMLRNKDIGVFCNIAPATLADPARFAQCLDFLDANRANAAAFVLEFRQSAFERLGAMEREHLAALAQRGYRFSIDHVENLRIEPRELADRGVRFIKVSAALLLDQAHGATADIHAADLSDLLGRFGIDLIAERIEGERAVVDLLDYNVRFGQGFLFAAPKPLRPETAPVPPPGLHGRPAAPTSPDPSKQETLVASQTIEPRRIDPSRGNAALARRAVRPH